MFNFDLLDVDCLGLGPCVYALTVTGLLGEA